MPDHELNPLSDDSPEREPVFGDLGEDHEIASMADAHEEEIPHGSAWGQEQEVEAEAHSQPPSRARLGEEDIAASGGIESEGTESANIDGWNENSYRLLTSELGIIEGQVRAILGPQDPRRKRKFAGTQRWKELEEDIQEWRFTGRYEEDSLRDLLRLIARRHYLFDRLTFLAVTRPTWNS